MIDQNSVNESLNTAINNGYELDEWSAEDIADDLATYDSQFENVEPAELLPFIVEWKNARQNA